MCVCVLVMQKLQYNKIPVLYLMKYIVVATVEDIALHDQRIVC